jgi:Tfp pilus assembly protein PilF
MLRGLMGFCRRSSLRRASVLAAALALGAAPVAAQTAPVNAEEESNAAIARGVQLRQAGNDDEALAEFRRADQLMPSPRTKAQIALAEQALGQWVAAERDLRAALSTADDPWI